MPKQIRLLWSSSGPIPVKWMSKRIDVSVPTINAWLKDTHDYDIEGREKKKPGGKKGQVYRKAKKPREHKDWTMADELRENLRRVTGV